MVDPDEDPTLSLILQAPLTEMALPRSVVIAKIEAYSPQIITHLVKLVAVVHRDQDRMKWVSEIAGWLYSITKVQCKGEKEDFDFYLGPLWTDIYADDPASHLQVFARELAEEGYPIDPTVRLSALTKVVAEFMVGAARILADKHVVLAERKQLLRQFAEAFEVSTKR